jgi:Family of unknown function (DUF6459)
MPLTPLRLVTVPDTAPPYDCETHGAACPAGRDMAGADPLGLTGQPPERVSPGRTPARPDLLRREAGPGTGAGPGPRASSASPANSASPASSASPATRFAPEGQGAAWPLQFAQVVVEILAGARSPRQIVPCITDRVRAHLGQLVPLLASDQRPRIQRILTSRPTARAVEMTVVVSFGPRSRALAVRCEHLPARPAAPGLPPRPARWLCTELIAG